MAERKIRQADLDALESRMQLYVNKEIERHIWLMAKIFAVPLIGATAKLLEIGEKILAALP